MKNKLLNISLLILLSFSTNSQLFTEYDDCGVSVATKALLENSNEWISNDLNYDISIGLYYDFVNSDYFSIPIYLSYSRSQIIFKQIQGKEVINPNYIDLEFAYRRHLIFGISSRIYVEGGINNRIILGNNSFKNLNGTEFQFKKFSIIPKIAVGIEIYGRQKPFVYLNLEYWNTLSGYLISPDRPLNKHIGIRASFPVLQ